MNEANEKIIIDGLEVIPLMGNVVVELIKETVEKHLNEVMEVKKFETLSKAGFTTAVTKENEGKVPLKKGKVVLLGKDAYGERFKKCYGNDTEKPRIGDTVMFTNYQQFNLDKENKYALLSDERIWCILRSPEND